MAETDPFSRLDAIFDAADKLLASGVVYLPGGQAKVSTILIDRLRYAVSLHKQAHQEPGNAP